MKFYNREQEISLLNDIRQRAFTEKSQFTVVTGRRRIGKTNMILKSCEDIPTVYLFVSRSNEAMLCNRFAKRINNSLDNIFISENTTAFSEIFESLMRAGKSRKFNLIIDEFQEFYHINKAIYSEIQGIWDEYKDVTNVNLIVSGSVYSLMHTIFQDRKEPLYGRADRIIKLKPFSTDVMKEIISDYNKNYCNDDLLALYTFTGGIPKYISIFMDNHCTTMPEMVDFMMQENSPFIEEGNALLIQEFGKKYGNYYSILAAIASGRNTNAELMASFGDSNVSGLLKRLEEDYEVIKKTRPIMAKEGSQTVRYEISDNFLRFWFRYIVKNLDYIQAENYESLADIIKEDYPTYSGLTLERYFRQKLKEQKIFKSIGSWWETSNSNNNNPNEIDIVAIYATEPEKVFIAEVKRQQKNFKPDAFQQKIDVIRTKLFHKFSIESRCLTLEDM